MEGNYLCLINGFREMFDGDLDFSSPATSHRDRDASTIFTGPVDSKIIDVPMTPTQSMTLPVLVHESRFPSDFSGTTALTDEEKADPTLATFRETITRPLQPNKPPNIQPHSHILPSISDTTTVT